MILNDRQLIERAEAGMIRPFKPQHVQPASIDLTLDNSFLVPKRDRLYPIDLANVADTIDDYEHIQSDTLRLDPHEFVLGSTVERIEIPPDLVGSVEGRSSLGRLGLFVHVTAGFIDPGFHGKITLEILNMNRCAIDLRAGKRICQIALTALTAPAERPYGHPDLGSHYQNQHQTTASRYDG
jgi:dCTP deaminase